MANWYTESGIRSTVQNLKFSQSFGWWALHPEKLYPYNRESAQAMHYTAEIKIQWSDELHLSGEGINNFHNNNLLLFSEET